jgi:hypothetical protein
MVLARRGRVVVVLCAVTGGVLVLAGHPRLLERLGGLLDGSPVPGEQSAALSSLLAGYGVLFLALALLRTLGKPSTETAVGFWDAGRTMWRDVASAARRGLASRGDAAWLCAIVGVGLVLRGAFLGTPMWYDESYSFLHFVKPGWPLLFDYPLPNNHVLHTILAKLSTLVWGEHPVSLRLPAFLAGLASIPLTFILCQRLGPKRSGFVVAMGMSVAPYLVLYSCMARGYSLVVCLSLALALSALYVADRTTWASRLLFSGLAALGLMTMPSMLFPIAGLVLWVACLLLVRGRTAVAVLQGFVVPCSVTLYALTLILYTPSIAVSGGVESLVANRFVLPAPWGEFFGQVFGHLRSTLSDYARDVPIPGLFLVMILFLVGVAWSARKRAWPALLLLPSLLAGSAAVFLVRRAIPFARTWIFFFPFGLIVADWGFTWLVERGSTRARQVALLVVFGLSGCFAVSLVARGAIAGYPDTGAFPEAPFVVRYLQPRTACHDAFRFKEPADAPMLFYLWYHGVAEDRAEPGGDAGRVFYVVKKSRYAIGDLTGDPVRKILDYGDAAVYEGLHGRQPKSLQHVLRTSWPAGRGKEAGGRVR